mmetsp:Transcript_20838/g.28333  ORF Transcript_20838/g.28333 Transcript_20838/m.28333 type:complete len:80 (-) Transcript_20838:256-495(-)
MPAGHLSRARRCWSTVTPASAVSRNDSFFCVCPDVCTQTFLRIRHAHLQQVDTDVTRRQLQGGRIGGVALTSKRGECIC